MPLPSKFLRLPASVQREVEACIIRNGYGGYREIATDLKRRGYSIGKTALHIEGSRIKARVEALRDRYFARLAGIGTSSGRESRK